MTGAFSDSTGKSGGFYGGLAGMLGYPPEATSYDNWGTPAIRSTYKGLGATVKSCYCLLYTSFRPADNPGRPRLG